MRGHQGPDRQTGDTLSASEADLLAFEGRWRKHTAAKERAIRDELGISPPRYYQLLERLLERPAAVRFDPMLVRSLRTSGAAGSPDVAGESRE